MNQWKLWFAQENETPLVTQSYFFSFDKKPEAISPSNSITLHILRWIHKTGQTGDWCLPAPCGPIQGPSATPEHNGTNVWKDSKCALNSAPMMPRGVCLCDSEGGFLQPDFCPPFQHLLSERLTSLGIMWEPRVPPLNPSETIVL